MGRSLSRSAQRGSLLQLVLCVVCCVLCMNALAAPPPLAIPASAEDSDGSSRGAWGFLDGVNRSTALLADMWGLRPALSRHGISLAVQETSEVLGNTTGGVAQGFMYDGLTQMLLQMDTQRAWGHYGGLFNVSVLDIHGKNLSAQNLQTLQTASGIEADRSLRLWELWYSQNFLDENRLNLKLGQQSLDQEFMVSTNAQYFVNTMMGWPMLPSADMPAGGPAYPLSTLGARLLLKPMDGLSVLGGVFSASPLRNDNGSDPQLQNPKGMSFPVGEGVLSMLEVQFSYPSLGALVSPDEPQPLGWTYRLGAWFNSKDFADQHYDDTGLSLASAASSGKALQHKGNYAWYAVADQLIWRDALDPNRTASVFARFMGTPLKDRNLIDFSVNAGVLFKSPFRYRASDTLGLGWGYAHVSSAASELDVDSFRLNGMSTGVTRSSEKFIELTYQYQWRPWIQIQPDLQYTINPGAGVALGSDPRQRLGNEWVMGVRTNILF